MSELSKWRSEELMNCQLVSSLFGLALIFAVLRVSIHIAGECQKFLLHSLAGWFLAAVRMFLFQKTALVGRCLVCSSIVLGYIALLPRCAEPKGLCKFFVQIEHLGCRLERALAFAVLGVFAFSPLTGQLVYGNH